MDNKVKWAKMKKNVNKNYFFIKYVPNLSDTLFDVILKKNMKIVVYLLNTYSTVLFDMPSGMGNDTDMGFRCPKSANT